MSTRDPLSPPTVKPVLPVHDMGDGDGFYERLGFDVERFDSNYSIVGHSGHELFHLQVSDDFDRHSNPTSMYLHVSDAERWHTNWQDAGVSVGEIADREWGMREFSMTDPSGNTLRVGNNL
jgi:hypothetical protein